MPQLLSVIVPAFNEGQRIGKFLDELIEFKKETNIKTEIIVVNDGSTDNTLQVLFAFKPDIKIISYERNKGKGAAIMSGIKAAKGELIAFMDADGATPASELLSIVSALKKFDFVCGARNIAGSNVIVKRPLAKRIISRLFNFYTGLLFETSCPDILCGFKGMKKEIAKTLANQMSCGGWIFDVELLARTKALGASIGVIPIEWSYAPGSKMRVNVETITAVFSMLKLRAMLGKEGLLK